MGREILDYQTCPHVFILKVREIGRVDMLVPTAQVRKLKPRV